MKLFSIFTRRLLTRPTLTRSTLSLLSLTAAYSLYHHHHPLALPRLSQPGGVALAEAEGASVDPYWRTRQGMKMDRHEEAVVIGASGSNPELAKAVTRGLGLAAPAKTVSKRFADGETFVKVDDNVNGKHVYIV